MLQVQGHSLRCVVWVCHWLQTGYFWSVVSINKSNQCNQSLYYSRYEGRNIETVSLNAKNPLSDVIKWSDEGQMGLFFRTEVYLTRRWKTLPSLKVSRALRKQMYLQHSATLTIQEMPFAKSLSAVSLWNQQVLILSEKNKLKNIESLRTKTIRYSIDTQLPLVNLELMSACCIKQWLFKPQTVRIQWLLLHW